MRSRLVLAAIALTVARFPVARAKDHRTLWLYEDHRNEELTVRPFGDFGVPTTLAWGELNRFFRSWRTDDERTMNARLFRTLAQIQSHFGGSRMHLVSGYREPRKGERESYHSVGHASDVYLEGVSCRDLFDYCRELQADGQALGCGLYPNGSFVHIDVRGSSAIWIDVSTKAEGAKYVASASSWLKDHPEAGR